jgi:hypothetical protein
MLLRKGEKIIKEGIVEYKGSGIRKPLLFASAYGKMYLTDRRLVLEYYHLAIPTLNKVYGILKRKIEIALAKITDVKQIFPGSAVVVIEYVEDKQIKGYLYFAPWKAFAGLSLPRIAEDWIQKIQQLRGKSSHSNMT